MSEAETIKKGRRLAEFIGLHIPEWDKLPLWSRGIIRDMMMAWGKKVEEKEEKVG